MSFNDSNSDGIISPDKIPLRNLFYSNDTRSEGSFIISDNDVVMILKIYSIANSVLCVLGILSNVSNVAVFAKQGFQESFNIALFALSISDLASMITLLWQSISSSQWFQDTGIPIQCLTIGYVFGMLPHFVCIRVSSWLTAYVAFERCICVIFPLKVKSILTLKRVKLIMCIIFLVNISIFIPHFYSIRYQWRYVVRRNTSLLGVRYIDEFAKIKPPNFIVSGIVSPFSCMLLITIFSIILVVKLNQKRKWRQETIANSENFNKSSTQDRKIVKMVMVIAAIFIVCYLPLTLANYRASTDSEFTMTGKNKNLFWCVACIVLLMEAINANANIIIYYSMSSKYRSAFLNMFTNKSFKIT